MPEHTITLNSLFGRVKLVPPDPKFDTLVAEFRTHPESRKHLRMLPTTATTEEIKIRREARAENPQNVDIYAFTINEDDSLSENLVGVTGFFNIDTNNNSCEIGILVAPGRHREGYGTELVGTVLQYVFEERMFHRATFETAADNTAMRGFFERAGIRLEARRKEAWRVLDGSYEDAMGYALLDYEWRDRVKVNLQGMMQARLGR